MGRSKWWPRVPEDIQLKTLQDITSQFEEAMSKPLAEHDIVQCARLMKRLQLVLDDYIGPWPPQKYGAYYRFVPLAEELREVRHRGRRSIRRVCIYRFLTCPEADREKWLDILRIDAERGWFTEAELDEDWAAAERKAADRSVRFLDDLRYH